MDNTELAYAAGFFDGEGCFGIKMHAGKHGPFHTPYATISQIRPEILIWLRSHFGGSIRFNPSSGRNGIWALQLSARKSLDLMKALQPFLRIKRAEVDLILEAFASPTVNRRGGVLKEVQELRQANREKVMAIRRG